MDGERVSKPAGRHHRRGHVAPSIGPQVKKRGSIWWVIGTLRVASVDGGIRSVRIRRSTGLKATAELKAFAETIRDKWCLKIRNETILGVVQSPPVPVAAAEFLARPRRNGRPPGQREINVIAEVTGRFKELAVDEISPALWLQLVNERNQANAASTRERYITPIVAFLNWCAAPARKYVTSVPEFERNKGARNPKHRQRRRVADLRPELIALFIENAGWHLKPQLWVEWSTGARVSSVLHAIRLCDVILAPGREQIAFGKTKNGEPVFAALHPQAAAAVQAYLKRRGRLHDREGALFRKKDGTPYKANGLSGQNRTAFNNAKARTLKALRRQALAIALELRRAQRHDEAREVIGQAWADIKLMRQVTQHWFRHLLATTYLSKGLLRAGMDQGGWLDVKSFMGYAHDVDQVRRQAVLDMPVPELKPKTA